MKTVNYEEKLGEIRFPDGFRETLDNLTIEEQMECYRTTTYSGYSMTNWRERTYIGSATRLEKSSDVTALIVKDGILVGVMMTDDCGRNVPCFAEESVCTYYSCDNNGSGYKERIDYCYLICVSKSFNKEN